MSTNLVNTEPRFIGSQTKTGAIGLGCWRLTSNDDSHNHALISHALELGCTLIENADVYGFDWGGIGFGSCEEALGRIITRDPAIRSRMVLATKAGIIPGVPYDSSAQYLISACESSLRRMNTDYVDLFQIHRPDHFTHPEEVAQVLQSLQQRGLIRSFGVSNYTPVQTAALNQFLPKPIATTQPEFSALQLAPMRDGTFEMCMTNGTIPLAWSALAGGRLATGTGVSTELIEVLDNIALRESVTRSAVAIAFVLAHPSCPVALVGTQNIERLTEIAQATEVSLDRTDVYQIVQASDGVPLP